MPPSAQAKRALLVVDVDYNDGWKPELVADPPSRQEVATALKKQLGYSRAISTPVIFVMLDRQKEQKLLPKPQLEPKKHCVGCDREENKLAGFLAHRHWSPFEPVFIKSTDDAFTVPELAPYLRSLKIEELLIVGCNTFACIQATAQGAVRNGFHVTLMEDSVFPPFSPPPDGYQCPKEAWVKSVQQYAPPNTGITVAVQSPL